MAPPTRPCPALSHAVRHIRSGLCATGLHPQSIRRTTFMNTQNPTLRQRDHHRRGAAYAPAPPHPAPVNRRLAWYVGPETTRGPADGPPGSPEGNVFDAMSAG
ncbi:hypothetical protein GCM10010446_66980 [Streptomyces enissocaesilis]|uniref:Uncharacterized protein n=1 Tax=Streptomyces enissocaesilis TaxID=332589 RepID=A0ABN3XNF1_9ACTN